MKAYSDVIHLSKNSRGVYSLDTIMGCASGTKDNDKGCYNDCYAANYARRYGYDFSNFVRRGFINQRHADNTTLKINLIDMPFVRVGTSGDPSEDWEHTIHTLEKLYCLEKPIVIITKHWNNLSDEQLIRLFCLNVHINTSVSALDNPQTLCNGLAQYNRVKPYCHSRLRVVTADFNLLHPDGYRFNEIQKTLISIDGYIDTVFRASSKNNPLITEGIIKTKVSRFMDKKMIVSKANRSPYLGKCDTCREMCGVSMPKKERLDRPIKKTPIGYMHKQGMLWA